MKLRSIQIGVGMLALIGGCLGFGLEVRAKELTAMEGGERVSPLRLAPCQRVDGQVRRTGDWVDYSEAERGCCSTTVAFDFFQTDGGCASTPTGGGCVAIDDPAARWYFGDSYCNGMAVNDVSVLDGTLGALATRIQFAWFSPYPEEEMLIAVLTGEDFAQDCTGYGDSYPGILYDFGTLPFHHNGYFWTDVDLCRLGLHQQLPQRESGWYSMQFLTDGGERMASCAQPMLWGPRIMERDGYSHELQLDDDSPRDGQYQLPTECYSYDFGVCPGYPLAAMMAMYAADMTDPCAEYGCDSSSCTLRKARCKVRRDRLDVIVKGTLAGGETSCVLLDGRFGACATGRSDGTFRTVLSQQESGPHFIEGCGVTLAVECP